MRNPQKNRPHLPQAAEIPTLEDVRDAVESSDTLPPVRIRDLVSAISCFCRLIGAAPDSVQLDLGAIRDRLDAIHPVVHGISAKRLANLRSDLFAAIAASGLKRAAPAGQGLTEPWQELKATLKTKRHRIGLSRLARHASAEGLAPREVNDTVIAGFMNQVRENSLHRKPNDLHRRTAVIWNEIVAAFPALGLCKITVPSYLPPPRRVDLALLPQSFRNDMEAYLAWCANTDPFAAGARARPLAPATIALRRAEIHAAVTALVESGVEPAKIIELADLVTITNFKRIAQRRLTLADGKENAFNKGIVKTLVQITREWVHADGTTLTELKRLASKLPAPHADLTQKNKRFLRQFDDPVVLQRLKDLRRRLWSKACRDTSPNFRTLAMAQAALALEILTYMPLRMQNLSRLAFDENLFLHDGLGAVSSLEIPANEVKNKRPIAFDVPPHIVRMLIAYRDRLAPKIIGKKPERLFVNPDGTPKLAQTLSKLIRRVVRKQAGVELSPHQFRHLAAKILLDNSPGAFELVKQLLGHQNLKTTANFYTGIDTRRASRHHYRLLEKMFQEQAQPSRRRDGKRRHKPKNQKNKKGSD
jgi:integrase